MLKGGAELAALTVIAIAAATGLLVLTNPAVIENPWIPVTGEAVAGGPAIAEGAPIGSDPDSFADTPPLPPDEPTEPQPELPEPRRVPPSGGGGGGGEAGGDEPAPQPEPPIVIPEPPKPRADLPLSPQWDSEVKVEVFAELDKQAARIPAAAAEARFAAGVGRFTGNVENVLLEEPALLWKEGYIGSDGLVSLVLTLDAPWTGSTGERWREWARAEARHKLEQYGFSPPVRALDVAGLHFAQVRAPVGAARTLALPGVNVSLDKRFSANLNESVRNVSAPQAWNQTDSSGRNLFGTGVTIAILDTGVDYTHADLGGCTTTQFTGGTCAKVPKGYDFVNNDGDPADDHGHGTHVASIAAGNGTFKGVAPNATIYAYKVMDSAGNGNTSTILLGIAAALDPNNDSSTADHADIISMSLGGPGDPDDPVSQAVDRAVDAGAVVVVSAGNNGLLSPGIARKALTVGAVTKAGSDATFTSSGVTAVGQVKPEVRAPGDAICAARWGTNTLGSMCGGDSAHIFLSGTSMATPHVAGLVALLKQKNASWDALEYRQAAKNLTATIRDPIDGSTVAGGHFGSSGGMLVNASRAVAADQSLPVALFNGERGKYVIGQTYNTVSRYYRTEAVIDSVRNVVGYAYGKNFKNYSVEIKSVPSTEIVGGNPFFSTRNSYEDNGWTQLASGTSAVTNGTLVSNFNNSKYSQGQHFLRLTVWNTRGQSVKDYLVVNISNVLITSPAASILRSGSALSIAGTVAPENLSNWTVDIGQGFAPSGWSTASLSGNSGSGFVENGTLATLNLSSLRSGEYTIRVTARLRDGNVTNATRAFIWDPTDGDWPQNLGFSLDGFLLFPPNAQPTLADLDNDGRMELLFGINTNVTAYYPNGTLRWTVRIANQGSFSSGNLLTNGPAAGDINGDGYRDVVIGDNAGRVWVLDRNGNNVSGWPVTVGSSRFGAAVIGDVNGDGQNDIVIAERMSTSPYGRIHVLHKNGTAHSGWPQGLNGAASGSIIGALSLADFDGDGKLEIFGHGSTAIVTPPLSEAVLFWGNGTRIWTQSTGQIQGDWGNAISDINGDGALDVVYQEDKSTFINGTIPPAPAVLHALDIHGNEASGLPVYTRSIGWPSIGDFNNDGKPDVFIEDIINGSGSLYNTNSTSSSLLVADVDFDGRDDFISGITNDCLNTLIVGVPYCRVHGYYSNISNQTGVEITSFPHFIPNNGVSEGAIADIDGDGYLEYVNVNAFGFVHVWQLPDRIPNPRSYEIPWGQFHGNAQRTGTTNYTTAKRARITAESDAAVDTDGNGRYEKIQAVFTVKVNETATYKLRGTLYAPDGSVVSVSADNVTALSAGTRSASVSFPGREVFLSGQTGAFKLRGQLWRNVSSEDAIQYTWGIENISSYNASSFEPNGRLNGTFFNGTVDADGDGFADSLQVGVGVELLLGPGVYTVSADLQTPGGALMASGQNASALAVGNSTVWVKFSGTDIFAAKENGSYRLANVRLLNSAGTELDSKANPFNTSAHAWTQFQRTAKLLASGYADSRVDTDGNGLAEALRVSVPMDVRRDGTFTVTAELWDGTTKVNGSASTSALAAGERVVNLDFSGIAIFKNRRDTAFTVKNALVLDSDGDLLSAGDGPSTASYNYLDFEKSVKLTGYADRGVDNDSSADGLYNRLVVSVSIASVESGTFTVSGDVHDTDGTKVFSDSRTATLGLGENTVDLVFDGVEIYLNKKNGFTLRNVKVVDGSAREVDAVAGTAYTTGVSDYTLFQKPARLVSYSSAGVDNDSDTYYNGLRIDAAVAVTRPGSYTFSGSLYDRNGNKVGSGSVTGTLTEGSQTMSVTVNGVDVFENRVSGGWELRDAKLELGGAEVDRQSVSVSLGNYNYDEFQLPVRLTGSYSDYGLDTDANNKYDWLVFDATVAVTKPGTYTFFGTLLDANDNAIVESADTTATLSAGTQTVQLRFVGEDIRTTGKKKKGGYEFERLITKDSSGREIENEVDAAVSVNEYKSTDFDPATGNTKVVSCSETDNGQDYSNAGVTTGTKRSGSTLEAADFCISKGRSAGKLREYYCVTANNGKTYLKVKKAFACANVCGAGACV